jgi:predicted ATPase
MIVEVENFGPIKKGVVEFCPFTVFIGKNDSGKSYMGMLTYALYLGKSDWKIKISPTLFRKYLEIRKDGKIKQEIKETIPSVFGLISDIFPKDLELFHKWNEVIKDVNIEDIYKYPLFGNVKSHKIEINSDDVRTVLKSILKELYKAHFLKTLEHGFGNEVKNLIKFNEKSSNIRIVTDKCSVSVELIKSKKDSCKVSIIQLEVPNVNVIIDPTAEDTPTKIQDNTITMTIAEPIGLYTSLTDKLLHYLGLPTLVEPCYYLPASRSGMILGFEAFISGLLERIPFGVSKIPGVVSDFLNEIRNISSKTKGPLYELGSMLEREIGWNVSVERREQSFKITYKKGRKKYEKENVSSGILELSPFILYLKHVMLPFGMLIVEEPEAHIHPSLQRIFIRYLAKLVRSGMKVVVITHSDYILEQINTLIALSNLNEEQRKKFAEKAGYNQDDYLKPDEVSAYLFKIEEDGCTIEKLEIDEDGIVEDEFHRIREELYEEHLLIKKLKEGYV